MRDLEERQVVDAPSMESLLATFLRAAVGRYEIFQDLMLQFADKTLRISHYHFYNIKLCHHPVFQQIHMGVSYM